jgi:uncharacterized repeat protein (TIGR01451 family)
MTNGTFHEQLKKNILWKIAFLFFWTNLLTAQGWERFYGTPKADKPTGIVATSDGGAVLVGYTIEAQTAKQDVYLVKTDIDGRQEWAKRLGRQNINERGNAVVQNPDGTYLVVGTAYTDSVDTDGRVFIAKLNARGDSLWTRMLLANNYCTDAAYSVIRLRDGSGYMVAGTVCRPGLNIKDDIFLMRLDLAGNPVWHQVYGDASNFEFPRQVVETRDGQFTIVGVVGFYGVDNLRGLVLRTDRNGNQLWKKQIGQYELNDCTSVIADEQGGVILAGVETNNNFTPVSFLARYAANGQQIWKTTYDAFIWALRLMHAREGGYLLIAGNFGGKRNREWLRTDSIGNTLVRKKIHSFSTTDDMADATFNTEGGLLILGERVLSNNKEYHLMRLDAQGDLFANTVYGTLYHDQNANCRLDATEKYLAGWLVKAEGNGKTNYAYTDSLGSYSLGLDSSVYQLSVIKPNNYWTGCQDAVFVGLNSRVPRVAVNFGLKTALPCPLLEVDIASPYLRRCFENSYYVRYCNRGTRLAQGGFIRIVLDKTLIFNSAERPLSMRRGDTLFFNIPNLETNDCGTFSFKATVSCENTVLGQTHCVEAHIFPDSICAPAGDWSGASIAVNGSCQRDSIEFKVKNVGTGATRDPINYIVIEDNIIFIQSRIRLENNSEHIVKVPATGHTYRLIAEQEPNHPSAERRPTAVVEACRQNLVQPMSLGFVTQFAEDDGDPFVSIDCQQNRGSFDPNDKQAQPVGIGNQHFVDEQAEIDYTIRFQNTGTDTAFTVVVRDSLSPLLDPTTIRAGASSHQYTMSLLEGKVLKFSFQNIQLPDSFRSKLGSQGFIKFSIKLRPTIPFGSRIENRAGIYFDFNKPIITNTSFHTLRKPERVRQTNVQICENQPFKGKLYSPQTLRLYDTLRYQSFDSILLYWLKVLPSPKTSVDTSLQRGKPFRGIVYQRDTNVRVRFTAQNGCDSMVIYRLRLLTPIQNFGLDGLKIYPNPFSEKTVIELPYAILGRYAGSFDLKIYDTTGKLVTYQKSNDRRFELQRGSLTRGIYVFKIENQNLLITMGKLVVSD